MLNNNSILYYELQKTGCTYVRSILLSDKNNGFIEDGKYNGYTQLAQDIKYQFDSLLKVGNIRNP